MKKFSRIFVLFFAICMFANVHAAESDNMREVVVSYYDVNKIDIMPVEREKTFYLRKKDGSRFTKEDMAAMLVKKDVKNVVNGQEVALEKLDRKVKIGYNVFSNKEKEYKTYQIGVTCCKNIDKVKIDSKNAKVYIDVFFLSKKKIFVRHINATSFLDRQTGEIVGFGHNEISFAKKFTKEKSVASIYSSKTHILEGESLGKEIEGYQEQYIVDIDKIAEVTNILSKEKEYIGYKKIISSNQEEVEEVRKKIYSGSPLRLGNRDKRVFTEEDYKDTYVDFFYTERLEEKKEEKIVGEVADVKVIPEGKVAITAINENAMVASAEEVRVPVCENISAGIVDARPYIVTDVAYKVESKKEYETNGKNYFPLSYRYAKLHNLNVFSIKDSVTLHAKELLDRENISLPLTEEYKLKVNSMRFVPGSVTKNYVEEHVHDGCSVCKNIYLEVTVSADSVMCQDSYILNPLTVKTEKIKVREERCREENGAYVLDTYKTKYFTPQLKVLEKDNLEESLQLEMDMAKNPKKISAANNIYKENTFTVPAHKPNGEYVVTGELDYEKKLQIGKTNSSVEKVNLVLTGKQVVPVNVYTPVVANARLERVGEIVNHTNGDISANTISKNVPFVVIPQTNNMQHQMYGKITDFEKYTKEHYVSFNFDIAYYKVFAKDGSLFASKNELVEAGNAILVPCGGKVEACAASIPRKAPLNGKNTKFTVKTVAINAPANGNYTDTVLKEKSELVDEMFNKMTLSHKQYHGKEMKNERNYAVKKVFDVPVINRVYDFRVVNLRDYDFDEQFKVAKTTTLTGNFNYAGIRRLNTHASSSNALSANPGRTLPLGPYNHVNRLYGNAPRIGYYFDFDLKTTGKIAPGANKYIEVKPRFYYLSKDGKSIKLGKEIDVYYVEGKGRNVKVGSSQDGYRIKFTPSHCEEYVKNYDKSYIEKNLAKEEITIGKTTELRLNANTCMIQNEMQDEQLWVGRYSLPKTTFVVNKGEKDLKNKLKGGYLGVVLDINCVEEAGKNKIVTSYNQNNRNGVNVNSSQWDMEGYLGANIGVENTPSMRLEAGTWQMSNYIYNETKGTVMLYDLDNMALSE